MLTLPSGCYDNIGKVGVNSFYVICGLPSGVGVSLTVVKTFALAYSGTSLTFEETKGERT